MRNLWLVIKHELTCTLGKRSYWITTLLLPLIILALTFGAQFINQEMTDGEAKELLPGFVTENNTLQQPRGYIDRAAVLQNLPPALPADLLIPFSDETEARRALDAQEIKEYYLIEEDFLSTGEVTLVQENFSPLKQLSRDSLLSYLITYNLVDDPATTPLLRNPLQQSNSSALAPSQLVAAHNSGGLVTGDDELWTYAVPYAVLFIFFFTLTMSSSFMLHSVTAEKENRIVEVLLLSLRPTELMLGKILGLGVAALLQITIWLGGSLLTMSSHSFFKLASNISIDLPPGFIGWAGCYFLLGYLMFASLLGALGALAPNARAGNQFTFILMLPLMIPLWLQSSLLEAPQGKLAIFLSIFPLTAPVSMMARLAIVNVPRWQLLVSLGLLVVTTYGIVQLAAHFFRADTLLSNATLNWQRVKSVMLGGNER